MYAATQKDNLKLGGLSNQMGEMDRDFEEMMRMRNEAKKRLEEQFKDVYQKIKDNKQHTINEGKKVNESLKQFQDKFIFLMNQLTDQLNDRIQEEKEYMENERVRAHDRMAYIEELVRKEREDRVESLDTQLKPIKQDIKDIQLAIESERNARVQKEREILEVLQEESMKVEEAINIEKEERLERQGELYERVVTEIKRENDWISNFQNSTINEFNKDKADIEKEMDNRFQHQDEMVKNIQHFISTFQKTLKAVGDKN